MQRQKEENRNSSWRSGTTYCNKDATGTTMKLDAGIEVYGCPYGL